MKYSVFFCDMLFIVSVFFGCTTLDNSADKEVFTKISYGFTAGADYEIQMVAESDATWIRPHPGPFAWGWIEEQKGDFDFERTDEWVRKAGKYDINILATIWPFADWDQKRCHNDKKTVTSEDQFFPRERGDGIPVHRGIPCVMEDYEDFLIKLVERYDGDGIDDMPGLEKPLLYWEILNEPAIQEPFLTFFRGTPKEYFQILKTSYVTIKKASPESVVVQGGAMGNMKEALDYWKQVFEYGGGDYFDIANIHFIEYGDLSSLNVKDFKDLLTQMNINKPVWVTEAAFSSESDVERAVKGAIDAGAENILFAGFKIGQHGPPQIGVYSDIFLEIIQKD